MGEWIDIAAAEELPAGGRRLVRREGHEIALFHVDGCVYALGDSCPHNGSSLVMGKVEGTTVTCRAHGLRFDLATGCMRGAQGLTARSYPARVRDGRIEVELSTPSDRAAEPS